MDSQEFPVPSILSNNGAIAIIFSNQRSSADPEGYGSMANRMEQQARLQPGYLGIESVRDDSGRGITISYWKDRASAIAWKSVNEHTVAQKNGQETWYSSYMVRAARIDEEYGILGSSRIQSMDTIGPALWARYNAWANHRMLKATKELHENHYDVEIGRKTVRGLWNHLIQTDATWLHRFGLSGESILELAEIKGNNLQSFAEIELQRSRMDQDIIEFFSGSQPSRVQSTLNYVSNEDGLERNLDVRIAFFHFFNHQTFHRGQLSIILRQLGVTTEMTDIVWMMD